MSESMRAWAIDRYGDNSVVRMMTFPRPRIAGDEVLVQIKAASINPLDYRIRKGELRSVLPKRFPLILGNDCAGVVVAKGEGSPSLTGAVRTFDRIGLPQLILTKGTTDAPARQHLIGFTWIQDS